MGKTKPRLSFRTTLKRERSGDIALIEVPGDVRAAFGKARPPVIAKLGKYMFRTTIAVCGGKSYIGVRRSHREAGKLEPGRVLSVVIELDDAPRVVKPPADLAAALEMNPVALARWNELSFTHKKEHAEAITNAKKPETRARRVKATLSMLKKKS